MFVYSIAKTKMLLNNSKGTSTLQLQLFWLYFLIFFYCTHYYYAFICNHTFAAENDTSAWNVWGFVFEVPHRTHHANDNCSSLFYHSVTLFMMCMSNSHVLLSFFKRLNHLHLDLLISWFWFFFFFFVVILSVVFWIIIIPTHINRICCIIRKDLFVQTSSERMSVSHFLTSIPRILNLLSPQKFRFFSLVTYFLFICFSHSKNKFLCSLEVWSIWTHARTLNYYLSLSYPNRYKSS